MKQLAWFGIALMATTGAAALGACSAGGDKSELSGNGNGNGNGNGATTSSGSTGQGGFDGGDDGSNDGSGGSCQAIAAEANPALQPADIIFGVDTSGSMGEESAFVKAELNAFSQQIIASGIDVRVIMIAEPPPAGFPCIGGICPPGICIDPPLGSGNCPDDTNLPHYFHVPNREVSSTDGLNIFYESYGEWSMHLRPDATKSLVIITDDNATMAPYNDAATFVTDFTALDPVLLANWKMSGIYSFSNCSSAANPGMIWKDVVDQTGGVHGDLCNQDFQPIFDDLAAQIVIGAAQLPCQWDIPEPPDGKQLDPAQVNVEFTDGGAVTNSILKVSDASACDAATGGWYYDDDANPSTIHLCQQSCDVVSADDAGKIDLLFGCATALK
jgi:hypothetical protein